MVVAADSSGSQPLVQFGTMREAIGDKQDQGRVRFKDLLRRPHFYAVAALEKLHGEATILDGKLTITKVDAAGDLEPDQGSLAEEQATLLVGAYVPSWSLHPVTYNVAADQFDDYVAETAEAAGIKTSDPFMFTIEGEFSDVFLHVINGACPIHARLKNSEVPKELRAFESEIPKVSGTLVGVFARDAVGKLTHPATSTHLHLLYKDPATGQDVTAHVERVAMGPGALLRLPK